MTPPPLMGVNSQHAQMILLGSVECQMVAAGLRGQSHSILVLISSLYLPASASFSRRRKGSGSVCNTNFQCYFPALLY